MLTTLDARYGTARGRAPARGADAAARHGPWCRLVPPRAVRPPPTPARPATTAPVRPGAAPALRKDTAQ
ncbi:hypothetical protein LUX01_19825 [Streptomyces sudanensis]|uniref:hypothetical protein n=1 Tax=Streptomyces TaxID=1883 RepID=UPI001319CF59|nr:MULTISPECIES: hypothetical protein [Streptomyces]MCP9988591.1 hypothetical protein [Streptomyces sudanensis]